MTEDGFNVERTDDIYSFASTKFIITYPDGHVGQLWSPPWHEWDDEEEDRRTLEAARKLFALGEHNKPDAKVRTDT